MIPELLKRLIAKHSSDVNTDYGLIVNSGRLRIFSLDHMVDGSSDRSQWQAYEIFGNCNKDLKVVSEDIDKTILVDDDRSYVASGQGPFICTS